MPNKTSDAQLRAIRKYKAEKLERVTVWVRKGDRDRYKAAAAALGDSLQGFVIRHLDALAEQAGIPPLDASAPDPSPDADAPATDPPPPEATT